MRKNKVRVKRDLKQNSNSNIRSNNRLGFVRLPFRRSPKPIISHQSSQDFRSLELMQILRREYLGDDKEQTVNDREILGRLSNASQLNEFLSQYKRLDNPEFQNFIRSKLQIFHDNLKMQRSIAARSEADAKAISYVSGAASAGFFGAVAYAGTYAIDMACTGGAATVIAIGSRLVCNYFGRETAATDKDIKLVNRVRVELAQRE